MSDDRDPRVAFRAPEGLVEWLDEQAEDAGLPRSEVCRRALHFMREARGDALEREAQIRDEIDTIISENQELRKVVPSKWRSHVQGLFVDDLRDETSPADLRTLAAGYRRQAEKMEELAETIPHAPEADLVGIVDEELRNALEAGDLSNWYDDVENPHEKHLAGVEDGMQERREAVAVVQGVVETHTRLAAAFEDRHEAPAVKPSDLPRFAESVLPDDVDREDVARLATMLVREGVPAEDVPDVLPTVDPSLEAEEVASRATGDDVDVEEATIRKGGVPIDAYESEPTGTDGGVPCAADGDELSQQRLAALAAADGGRHPRSLPPSEEVDTEETMNEPNDTDDDSTEAVSERLDELADAVEEVEGDE